MKSKLALQVLVVCFSVTLLGAYVVYAHRKAQAPAPQSSDASAAATTSADSASQEAEGFVQSGKTERPGESTERHTINASTIDGPVFRDASLPPSPGDVDMNPADVATSSATPLPVSLPTTLGENGKVQFRMDGSSVVTRVRDVGPQTIAPSSKVLINVFPSAAKKSDPPSPSVSTEVNGQNVRIDSFRNSEPPKLMAVLPPSTTTTASTPNPAAQAISRPAPTAPAAAPRETIIFSTKSAPVFVAPRTPSATAALLDPAIPKPTPPTTGTPLAGTPALVAPPAIPPPQPSPATIPNAHAPKADAAPPQQLQPRTERASQTVTPKPRLLAPGSKSMDLRFFTPQPTSPAPSPGQFPVPPAPEKPKP